MLIRNFRITDGLGNSVIRYVENVICKEGQNLPSLSITVIVKLLNYKRPTLEICVSITATIGNWGDTTDNMERHQHHRQHGATSITTEIMLDNHNL